MDFRQNNNLVSEVKLASLYLCCLYSNVEKSHPLQGWSFVGLYEVQSVVDVGLLIWLQASSRSEFFTAVKIDMFSLLDRKTM